MALAKNTVEWLYPSYTLRGGYSFQPDPEGFIEIPSVVDGMQSAFPRDRVARGSSSRILNGRVRDGRLVRRPGTSQYFSDVDDEEVLDLIEFSAPAGDVKLVRVTTNRISVDDGGGNWTDYVTGLSVSRRPTFAAFLDNLYIATGDFKVRQLDFSAETATEITNAPTAKYITTFAERVIAANIGSDVYKVQWPVNSDPTTWTGLGSGEENLVTMGGGLSDDITGIFGFEQVGVVLRKRSIWLIQRQPFSDNPFRFIPVYSGAGCDMPHTARKIPGGIIYGNSETGSLYRYIIGNAPQIISRGVEDELFSQVGSVGFSQAAYDELNGEYHLGEAPSSGSPNISRVWVVDLDTGAWERDDGPPTTCVSKAVAAVSGLFINDLTGTINDLEGTINSLGTEIRLESKIFKAKSGKIFFHPTSPTVTNDYNGTNFVFHFVSPNIGSISKRRTIQDICFIIKATSGCSATIDLSDDKTNWVNGITKSVPADDGLQEVYLRRQRFTGLNMYIRFRASGGPVEIESYWVRFHQKGESR